MKDFLIEMFGFNQDANIRMVKQVQDLPDNAEMLKHLNHLANCQYKWLDRIKVFPEISQLDWWAPVVSPDALAPRFTESTALWIEFLQGFDDDTLVRNVSYMGQDNEPWEAKLKDIALQLIFHSFHHRAQIQMMIRAGGGTPRFIDYIRSHSQKKRVG